MIGTFHCVYRHLHSAASPYNIGDRPFVYQHKDQCLDSMSTSTKLDESDASSAGLCHWYSDPRTLNDYRRGPLGPHFDSYANVLKRDGYGRSTALTYLSLACQFNRFLLDQAIRDANQIEWSQVEPFLKILLREVRTSSLTYCPRTRALNGFKRLFRFLYDSEIVAEPAPPPDTRPFAWILHEFIGFLRKAGKSECTVRSYRSIVEDFLLLLGEDTTQQAFGKLSQTSVDKAIHSLVENSRHNRRSLSGCLRGFLSYCEREKHLPCDFTPLIPRAKTYKDGSLPQGLDNKAVAKMLQQIDATTPNGAKDYATALLIMGYGVRGISVCQLTLDDINWEKATIVIRSQKGGKVVVMPLLPAVGDAIARWLKFRPRNTSYRHVFLSLRAPHGPITTIAVSHALCRYMKMAGIKSPAYGCRVLRHTWAIRALRNDVSIKAIADVFGHKSIRTTYIYAKADEKSLRQLAAPWPQS